MIIASLLFWNVILHSQKLRTLSLSWTLPSGTRAQGWQIIHSDCPPNEGGQRRSCSPIASLAGLENLRPFEIVSTSDYNLSHSFNIGTQLAAV
ncbi:hypothetical protein PHBOTO_006494 [Pseudozyma hubeiensis]|nr:hypothetical protein PHBOTO_006494 [Pseudozyma hubeiensis]